MEKNKNQEVEVQEKTNQEVEVQEKTNQEESNTNSEIEALKQELENLKKERHSLNSQLGNANKKIKDFENKNLTEEEKFAIKEQELKNKEKELSEKENSFKLKELELEKSIQLTQSEVFEEFKDFINIDINDTKESIKKKIEAILNKQKAFRENLLSEFNITQKTNVSKTTGKENEILKELGLKASKKVGLENI